MNQEVNYYVNILKENAFKEICKAEIKDASVDGKIEIPTLHFVVKDATGKLSVSCGINDIYDRDPRPISEHLKELIEIIKNLEHLEIPDERYTNLLIKELEKNQFYNIKFLRNKIDKVLIENIDLHIIFSKENKNYEAFIYKYWEEIQEKNEDFDSMNGYEFEQFCADVLQNIGYENVQMTQSSGDQGIDIIAFKYGIKYGIQCKCYNSIVGNKAVQEAFSGKMYYDCHVGIVLTNNYFSTAAKKLAQKNGIILWDREMLLDIINKK